MKVGIAAFSIKNITIVNYLGYKSILKFFILSCKNAILA